MWINQLTAHRGKGQKMEPIVTYRLYINGNLYSKSTSVLGLRAHCGFITGFPSDSASTVDLCSKLLRHGKSKAWYKGEKVEISLTET
jgi:hypothetical protein